jgi:hypothetical protein
MGSGFGEQEVQMVVHRGDGGASPGTLLMATSVIREPEMLPLRRRTSIANHAMCESDIRRSCGR